MGVVLEVFEPTGTVEIGERHAPRLDSLNGKTICELSNFRWEAGRIFPVIRELLKKRFPDIKIVPCTDLPDIAKIQPDALTKALKDKGCDAVIVSSAA